MTMKEYHKIETPYFRAEDGSKKLIEGEFRNEAVKACKDIEWVFTEKVDGTNIRIYWDGYSFTIGGRTDRASIPARLVEWFNQTFNNDAMEELFEQKFGEKEVILFGEGYGVGIQAVGKDYLTDSNSFIIFDITVDGKFLDPDNIVNVAKSLGLVYVPVCIRGTIDDAVKYVKSNPQSMLGSCTMEGVVGRPITNLYDKRGNRLIVKIKCKDFA